MGKALLFIASLTVVVAVIGCISMIYQLWFKKDN